MYTTSSLHHELSHVKSNYTCKFNPLPIVKAHMPMVIDWPFLKKFIVTTAHNGPCNKKPQAIAQEVGRFQKTQEPANNNWSKFRHLYVHQGSLLSPSVNALHATIIPQLSKPHLYHPSIHQANLRLLYTYPSNLTFDYSTPTFCLLPP